MKDYLHDHIRRSWSSPEPVRALPTDGNGTAYSTAPCFINTKQFTVIKCNNKALCAMIMRHPTVADCTLNLNIACYLLDHFLKSEITRISASGMVSNVVITSTLNTDYYETVLSISR